MFWIYLLACVAPFVTGQPCNGGSCFYEWERQLDLEGYHNTSGPQHTSRDVVQCGITCSQQPGCVSFFYVEQSGECKLQSVIVTTSTGLVPTATAKYFARNTGNQQPGVCPAGWLAHGESCYHFFETVSDFSQAETYCADRDSHPVFLETTDEMAFMKNHLNISYTLQKWWIGLTDVDIEGVYKWAGTNIVFDQSLGDWASGQPGSDFDCVFFNLHFDLQWFVGDCTRTDRSIICEIDI